VTEVGVQRLRLGFERSINNPARSYYCRASYQVLYFLVAVFHICLIQFIRRDLKIMMTFGSPFANSECDDKNEFSMPFEIKVTYTVARSPPLGRILYSPCPRYTLRDRETARVAELSRTSAPLYPIVECKGLE
jgi:hypothetical protein